MTVVLRPNESQDMLLKRFRKKVAKNGGVFTLSNLGAFRVDSFDAILNPPQATILATGRVVERPFAEGGKLGLVPTMKLSLSVDHRVLDGAAAARLLDELVGLLEAPAQALA